MNTSLGYGLGPDDDSLSKKEFDARIRVMRTLLRNLFRANVVPVIAVGNEGAGRFGYPAAFDEVVAVGAVDFAHEVASFSGSGHPKGESPVPDVMGYGVGVHSSLERDYEGRSIYQRLDGTSMATPHVAGVVALYRCQQPALAAEDVIQKLYDTALPLDGAPAARRGHGLARFVD